MEAEQVEVRAVAITTPVSHNRCPRTPEVPWLGAWPKSHSRRGQTLPDEVPVQQPAARRGGTVLPSRTARPRFRRVAADHRIFRLGSSDHIPSGAWLYLVARGVYNPAHLFLRLHLGRSQSEGASVITNSNYSPGRYGPSVAPDCLPQARAAMARCGPRSKVPRRTGLCRFAGSQAQRPLAPGGMAGKPRDGRDPSRELLARILQSPSIPRILVMRRIRRRAQTTCRAASSGCTAARHRCRQSRRAARGSWRPARRRREHGPRGSASCAGW